MWDLPRPGMELVSPALAGGFLTTAPPGKSPRWCFLRWLWKEYYYDVAFLYASVHRYSVSQHKWSELWKILTFLHPHPHPVFSDSSLGPIYLCTLRGLWPIVRAKICEQTAEPAPSPMASSMCLDTVDSLTFSQSFKTFSASERNIFPREGHWPTQKCGNGLCKYKAANIFLAERKISHADQKIIFNKQNKKYFWCIISKLRPFTGEGKSRQEKIHRHQTGYKSSRRPINSGLDSYLPLVAPCCICIHGLWPILGSLLVSWEKSGWRPKISHHFSRVSWLPAQMWILRPKDAQGCMINSVVVGLGMTCHLYETISISKGYWLNLTSWSIVLRFMSLFPQFIARVVNKKSYFDVVNSYHLSSNEES